ncbi:sugar phosphate isomerase/epimerase, partial [bacterium]|nr:sugar phosphate isomerase/epimerase [bacterium]
PALIPDHFIQNLSDLPALLPPLEKKYAKPKYNATFSTMWGIKSTPTLSDFFECSRRLGFAAVELNHMINSDMLQGFKPNGYTISSIHEPCPADVSAEKLKQLDHLISSTNEEYRRIGIESIKRSIDIAKHYGSKVVVIHSGHVDPSKQLENRMRAMVASGNSHTTEYCDLKEKLIRFRTEQAPPHFESVKKSICELLEYSRPYNIKLGIEVRYHYLEIPSPDELEVILSLASPDQIGFIYDVGHAQTLDRLGFYPHEEWLKRFSSRIIETHIHDVIGTTDHLAPGLGEVDFDMVARYLPDQAIRTCEFQDVNTYEQVKSALSFLAAKGCISKPQ